ncbi:hypothetical protein GJ700_12465 [Duganella sp. FT92W]|uniref:UVR domain-containing protein n=1 Tax=Pseudoduganella rivuli TaxID=2666085 RepID=A0A7X2IMK8_9BURK|nr:UvrB/UvrC motif-containing protein [Pseudoduganella rivuli]MRV72523.1 hypothetical protein [Pseudoduganella rivuli]
MSQTIGRIDREGRICFHDASLSIWEEGIAAARNAGGWKGANEWERQFKRDVFLRIVQTLNRLGWTCVIPPEMIKQYGMSFARNRRYCRKGDLQADLEISGRCVELKMFQNVNAPDRPDNDGRYQDDKEKHMPYVMRLEMERTRRRIRDCLCNIFTGYRFEQPRPKLGFDGVTALEYAAHRRRTTGHYVAALDRARIGNVGEDKSADGYQLENGTRVYAQDRCGRIITGVAFYDLNGQWQVVTGRYDLVRVWHKQIWIECPGDPRVKRNSHQRRKRLEGELQKAIAQMNFERAAVLRNVLFPGNPALFNVWHDEHRLFHCANFCGYTNDRSKAGRFTATEVAGWRVAPNKVIPIDDREVA